MTRKETPLTEKQSAFAAEHHALVYRYLSNRRLSQDEFYDVAVFGYLRAVRRYLELEALRQYAFTTIAWRAMDTEIGGFYRARRALKRSNLVELLDEDTMTDVPCCDAEEKVIDLEMVRRLRGCLTPSQDWMLALASEGYTRREIARTCGTAAEAVDQEMADARDNIVRFAPDLELWAA